MEGFQNDPGIPGIQILDTPTDDNRQSCQSVKKISFGCGAERIIIIGLDKDSLTPECLCRSLTTKMFGASIAVLSTQIQSTKFDVSAFSRLSIGPFIRLRELQSVSILCYVLN